MSRPLLRTALLLLLLGACAAPDAAPDAGSSPAAADVTAADPFYRVSDYDAGAVAGGPGAGRTYGLGRAPATAALARLDRDIGLDGHELPPGRGSVAEGAVLYRAQCASCHGARGEGMLPAFPALIGRDSAAEGFRFAGNPKLVPTIGNYWPFATTIFDYIRRAMPLLAPGSLSDDQVYALTAYLLAANAVIPETSTLDAAALRAVRMPYVDRFIPDAAQAPGFSK
jgi:mono/diheme cytochrome c family protein